LGQPKLNELNNWLEVLRAGPYVPYMYSRCSLTSQALGWIIIQIRNKTEYSRQKKVPLFIQLNFLQLIKQKTLAWETGNCDGKRALHGERKLIYGSLGSQKQTKTVIKPTFG